MLKHDNSLRRTLAPSRTAEEGDLVWIHQHVKRSPDDPGNAVVNTFRMVDGKFAEHWNVNQPVPVESKNDNTYVLGMLNTGITNQWSRTPVNSDIRWQYLSGEKHG